MRCPFCGKYRHPSKKTAAREATYQIRRRRFLIRLRGPVYNLIGTVQLHCRFGGRYKTSGKARGISDRDKAERFHPQFPCRNAALILNVSIKDDQRHMCAALKSMGETSGRVENRS